MPRVAPSAPIPEARAYLFPRSRDPAVSFPAAEGEVEPVVRRYLKLGHRKSLVWNALPQAQEQNHFKNGRLCARECDYVANG